jgi:CMP/dCMP kinase
MRRVIAIDGPAGAGKSSVSRALAERLGFSYIDTGAMYRAVGVLAAETGIALDDDAGLGRLLGGLTFGVDGARVTVNDRDMSDVIRRSDAGELASQVSTRPAVRTRLVELQRRLAEGFDVVMEGRDIGTVVFPDAELKVYLTATAEERGRRRGIELRARGEAVDDDALVAGLRKRDARDAGRAVAPLRAADGAIELDTSSLSFEAVVDHLEGLARARMRRPGT